MCIEETSIDVTNPGKMCKPCFSGFKRYYKLQVELEEKLAPALQQMQFSRRAEPDPECLATPPPKRRVPPTSSRTSTSIPAFISSTASPPVSVILCKVHVHESCPHPPCKTRKYYFVPPCNLHAPLQCSWLPLESVIMHSIAVVI